MWNSIFGSNCYPQVAPPTATQVQQARDYQNMMAQAFDPYSYNDQMRNRKPRSYLIGPTQEESETFESVKNAWEAVEQAYEEYEIVRKLTGTGRI